MLAHLEGLPVGPVGGVVHLGAGVEPGEGGEGVDPGPAGAGEGAHQAADAAQGRNGGRRQRRVHQQLRHQVPGPVDDRQVHAIPAHRTLTHTHTQTDTERKTNRSGYDRAKGDCHDTHANKPSLPKYMTS